MPKLVTSPRKTEVTNNQPADKLNPKIQQELLNHLRVDGNLTIGNITQQNITLIVQLESPDQQEQIIESICQYLELVKVIADAQYTPEIHKVPPLNPRASLDAAVITPQSSPPTTSTFEFEVVTVDAQGQETKRSRKQAQCFVEILVLPYLVCQTNN